MSCISLSGSTECPSWDSSSISTTATTDYDFLQYVSDRATFDSALASYVQTSYVEKQFEERLGCQSINLTNTTNLYPRFLKSTICSSIVQASIDACNLTSSESRPLCADSCADFAESEVYIVEDTSLCSNASSNALSLIRADFTTCALPDSSLSSAECIAGSDNEPDNCGYSSSTIGLCSYCSSGGINSTDTCCYNADAEDKCSDVVLPNITTTMSFTTVTASATVTGNATVSGSTSHGLSGGAIAGVVIGSVAGAALLAFLIFLALLILKRRRNGSQNGSVFNQPSPARKGTAISQPAGHSSQGPEQFGVLPGGRIARMSALEGHDDVRSSTHMERGGSVAAMATGAAAGYSVRSGSRRRGDESSSDGFNDSPDSETRRGILRPPPTRRNGSLSSGSVLAVEDPQSPSSAGGMSSPQAVTSQQSEQLPFFKDYYSQDDIHPGDRVSVLWAYQPRAADEFALERGDMLKVVGIWDDGWATGVILDEQAEDWEARRQAQRDSGVSNTSGRGRDISPAVSGEIKAFPLVCVCLPEHWRKTIEGDGSTETGSSGNPGAHGS